MIKIKIFIILIAFIFLGACGYKSIYDDKQGGFIITEIKFEGDKTLNNITSRRFQNYLLQNNDLSNIDIKEFILDIESSTSRNILTRNSAGKVSMFELTVNLEVKIFNEKGLLFEKSFSAKNLYNNESNKFALSQYEKIIKKELLEKLIDELINYLSNI
tara:strand:- start:204 stop:680 length:477 start_codon:yes stop_codon:yes gene_type:complete